MPSEDNTFAIPVELQIETLISLRILSREQYGINELTSSASIKKLLKFTGLNGDVKLTLSRIINDNSGLALQGEVNTHSHLSVHMLQMYSHNYTYSPLLRT